MNNDILIIGGGIIGVSAAYALAREGVSVTLIEKSDLCAGSSHGNAGMVCRTAARGELYLDISNYHCDGNTEDEGYAVVTVTRQNAPAACAAYDIEIDTD